MFDGGILAVIAVESSSIIQKVFLISHFALNQAFNFHFKKQFPLKLCINL